MPEPSKIWWTAVELAEAALPGLPTHTSNINIYARKKGWRDDPDLSRKREGQGGGWEYHWTLLPEKARVKLLVDRPVDLDAIPPLPGARALPEVDSLPPAAQKAARRRLAVLQNVQALYLGGNTKQGAVYLASLAAKVSQRTVWNWIELTYGLDEKDWLAALAPRSRQSRAHKKVEIPARFMDLLKGDYLRNEAPSFCSVYRRVMRVAEAEGLDGIPGERLARRRLNELVPKVTQVFAREGHRGLQRLFPPQIRDKTQLSALEAVNADCHKIDVFVRWPGSDKVERPQIVAFQDIYSGKILSWRVDHSPNKVMVMAAWADLIRDEGIPKHCLFDNGREFANKWLTGGAPTRFRFKVREDEALGALSMLGVKIHWAKPAHGQAKPVERAFRDWAEDVAKHPDFAGAYVGRRPDAKPENYGSTAVDLADFIAVLDQEIQEMNARPGRTSHTCKGRSFDETYAESYKRDPVAKATPDQVRMCLMAQQDLTPHKDHGRIRFQGNMYYAPWCIEIAGQKVVARFDPENLHAGLHVYTTDGQFLGEAPCQEAVGFFDMDAAHKTARKERAIRKAEQNLLRELAPTGVDEVASALRALTPDQVARPEAKVVEGRFWDRQGTDHGLPPMQTTPPVPEMTEAEKTERSAFLAKLDARRAQQAKTAPVDEARLRFTRALELAQRAEAGEKLGEADGKWLASYRQSTEWRTHLRLIEIHGDAMLAK